MIRIAADQVDRETECEGILRKRYGWLTMQKEYYNIMKIITL